MKEGTIIRNKSASDTFLADILRMEQECLSKDFEDFSSFLNDETSPNEKTYKVFVYGSLLRGFGNHRLLKDSKLLGVNSTKKRYKMISLGGFPGVLKARKEELHKKFLFKNIIGELYEVDAFTLRALDALEGNGYFYKREVVPLKNNNEEAWMYVLLNSSEYKNNSLCKIDNFGNYCWTTTKQRKR